LFFNKVKQTFGIEDVSVAMMMSQAMIGAIVYFIDRLFSASGSAHIPFEIRSQVVCADSGHVGKCYRVAGIRCCDKASTPEAALFRC
jgi:hypothetical protein